MCISKEIADLIIYLHIYKYIFTLDEKSGYNQDTAILENKLRAIDQKLCAYVALGKSDSQTKFQSSLILGLATRGPKPRYI
jgi:hypothetical protein